jgi:hypothetical protein
MPYLGSNSLRHVVPPRPAPSLTPVVCPDPVEWARSALHFQPDAVQQRILRAAGHRLMLCCTRQFGKSTITSVKALHFALRHPGSLVLVVARCQRQSAEWLLKVRVWLARLGIKAPGDGINRHSAVLPNGSRLVALPGNDDNIRTFSAVSLLVIDEAARVPDDLYAALLPMLAVSRGALWLLSTPRNQWGFFFENWRRDMPAFEKFFVPATECPRIPADFLAEARIELGEVNFRRDYLCEFAASEDQLIPRELWQQCVDPRFEAWFGGQPIFPGSTL